MRKTIVGARRADPNVYLAQLQQLFINNRRHRLRVRLVVHGGQIDRRDVVALVVINHPLQRSGDG